MACECLGYSRDEVLEMTLMDIDTPDAARIAPEHIRHLHQEGIISFETAHQRKDGQQFPVEITSRLIDHEGETWILSTVRDITKRKRAEEQIYYLAYYDELTGLPNRRLFYDRLKQVTARCEHFGEGGVVFLVDVTRLREVNDTLGQ